MATDLLARTVRGLEWVAAAEISRLPGVSGVRMLPREVAFRLPVLDASLLELRTVDDIFVSAGTIDGVGHRRDAPAVLAEVLPETALLAAIDRVRAVRELPGRPTFDVVASLAGQRNYNRYAVEDSVGTALRARLGRYQSHEPSRRDPEADTAQLSVRLMLLEQQASFAIRVPARPLHRRPYKLETGPGSLHPPLAAAMVALADPPADGVSADPCCGDGTIAIELALSRPGAITLAADIDAARLAHTVNNAERAGVTLTVVCADAARLPVPERSVDAIVTNPPWNRTVGLRGAPAGATDLLWRSLAGTLGRNGRLCTIGDAEQRPAARLAELGYTVAIAHTVRLHGRLSEVVLAAPPGARPVRLGRELARWRDTAVSMNVIDEHGF
jgi:tRNA (guanine6-N2)-methyltransferase